MAFHHLDKYARDDSIVKLIFDHLRNIGLCALVLAVAAWKEKNIGLGWVAVWDHLGAAVLVFVGFGLLWINHENLFSKVRNSNQSKWLKFMFALIYTILLIELVKYVREGKGA